MWSLYTVETSIIDYLVTCALNGAWFAVLYMKGNRQEYPYVLDSLVLLSAKALTYPLETFVGYTTLFSLVFPVVYFAFQLSLDFIFLTSGEHKCESRSWLIFRIFLFSFCFVGLPGIVQFSVYVGYLFSLYFLFKDAAKKERSLLGSWLLVPVPLIVVVLAHIPVVCVLFTAVYYNNNKKKLVEEEEEAEDSNEEEEEEQQKQQEIPFQRRENKREYRVWRPNQRITQQTSVGFVDDQENNYFKTKEYKEKLDEYEKGSLKEKTKQSPYDYANEKKLPFVPLSV